MFDIVQELEKIGNISTTRCSITLWIGSKYSFSHGRDVYFGKLK